MHVSGNRWTVMLWLLLPWLLTVACRGPSGTPTLTCESCRIVCGQCEEPDRFVRLNADQGHPEPDRRQLSSPPALPSDAWATLLAGIRVQKQEAFLLPLSQPSLAEPAFTPDDVAYLSATLPQAFAQAQAGDLVVFGISHPRAPELEELTSGGWSFETDGLHLRLANYHYVVSMPTIREFVWANPLHSHLSAYEFVPQSHHFVKKNGGALRAEPAELVLSYGSILAPPPISGGGLTVPSSPPSESHRDTVEDRLSALKRLYEKGLINEAEYSEQKRRILEAL
ncbi:MAG: SHOCT domain-containing protein [Nitrospira sp.]